MERRKLFSKPRRSLFSAPTNTQVRRRLFSGSTVDTVFPGFERM